jgi:hypothetical protein
MNWNTISLEMIGWRPLKSIIDEHANRLELLELRPPFLLVPRTVSLLLRKASFLKVIQQAVAQFWSSKRLTRVRIGA